MKDSTASVAIAGIMGVCFVLVSLIAVSDINYTKGFNNGKDRAIDVILRNKNIVCDK